MRAAAVVARVHFFHVISNTYVTLGEACACVRAHGNACVWGCVWGCVCVCVCGCVCVYVRTHECYCVYSPVTGSVPLFQALAGDLVLC